MIDQHATASDIAAAVARRHVSAEEVARAALDAIDAVDPRIRAFTEVQADMALRQARAVDTRIASGDRPGPLAGVPVAVKDNICLAWGRTTCASRMLEHYESPFTATAAARLMAAGAVIVGKTNMDEFAMGSSTERSAFGPTANPWDLARAPGGSSGGSAAAVAARLVPIAVGSDTGGSVRQPASLCGVVGLKPTYGRISRYGLVAYASSLDQIGPIAGTTTDAALALAAMAGPDPQDATTSARPLPDLLADIDQPIRPLTLGVPREARAAGIHPAVAAAFEDALAVFERAGARLIDIELPHAEHAIAAYYLVACAEASSNLARFDGVRYGRRAALGPGNDLGDLYALSRSQGLGPEVQRRIMLGVYALSSGYYDDYYAAAMRARRLIKADFDAAFAPADAGGCACHAVLMPTAPTPAFTLGELLTDPLALYLADIFTVSINLAGLPAISIPAGFTRPTDPFPAPLPIGLQIVAPPFAERVALRIARQFEAATDWHTRRPPLRALTPNAPPAHPPR